MIEKYFASSLVAGFTRIAAASSFPPQLSPIFAAHDSSRVISTSSDSEEAAFLTTLITTDAHVHPAKDYGRMYAIGDRFYRIEDKNRECLRWTRVLTFLSSSNKEDSAHIGQPLSLFHEEPLLSTVDRCDRCSGTARYYCYCVINNTIIIACTNKKFLHEQEDRRALDNSAQSLFTYLFYFRSGRMFDKDALESLNEKLI